MAIVELVMPKLGESIMEATILKWHKKVGDYVKFDETVLDIATDKVDSEVPSTEQGIIAEILFQVNDVVPIGAVIARIQTSPEEKTNDAPTSVTSAPIPAAIDQPIIATAPVFFEPTPESIQEVQVPVTESVPYTPATIIQEVSKAIGNRFYSPLVLNIANSEGISLSELERIPGTGNDGRVSKRDVLQYVADKKSGKIPSFQQPVYQQPVQTNITPVAQTPVSVPEKAAYTEPIPQTVPSYTSPAPTAPIIESVKEQINVDENKLSTVISEQIDSDYSPEVNYPDEVVNHPTHQDLIISQSPPQQAAEPQQIVNRNPIQPVIAPPTASGKFSDPSLVSISGATEILEMDRMRKLIAKHMVDSKHTSPHVTSFTEADVTNMVQWREKVKAEFESREGTKLTFTPMFIECVAAVIKNFPLINCSVVGDQIILKKDIHIGMATALPSGNLIVPVIKSADQLNIVGLSKAVNGLADAARNNRLKPEDTTGATFTLTNVGTFGSLMGTPIIPQPQVAILAVGAIKKRPMVIESATGDTIGIRHMMYLSLSYDHRIVDGSIGASFLTAVAKAFESWDPNKRWYQYL